MFAVLYSDKKGSGLCGDGQCPPMGVYYRSKKAAQACADDLQKSFPDVLYTVEPIRLAKK